VRRIECPEPDRWKMVASALHRGQCTKMYSRGAATPETLAGVDSSVSASPNRDLIAASTGLVALLGYCGGRHALVGRRSGTFPERRRDALWIESHVRDLFCA
jgi:hypothetical protein